MAEKIVALDSKLSEVVRALLEYIPGDYSTKRPDDPIGQAWHSAMMGLIEAAERIEALGEALCDKADITWEQAKTRIAELQAESEQREAVAMGA